MYLITASAKIFDGLKAAQYNLPELTNACVDRGNKKEIEELFYAIDKVIRRLEYIVVSEIKAGE